MNKLSDLVSSSLEYYDTNQEKYLEKFSNVYYVSFTKSNNENEHDVMNFYDKDKNLLYKSRYEILGLYVSKGSIWTWAWSIPTYKKNKTHISRRLLHYGTELEYNINVFLKSELITSRYKITNPIQLDIHSAIASYLSKQPLVYKFYDKEDEALYKKVTESGGLIDIREKVSNEHYTLYYLFLLDQKDFN